MTIEPQTNPEADVTPSADGTIQAGQAATPSDDGKGTPNDPVLMREDYTRKTQELARERESLAAEKARIEQERAMIQRQAYQQPTYQQPYQQQSDPLTEQFGSEGANAVKQVIGSAAQNVYQQLYAVEYAREEEKGASKYGEAWHKFDYTDPMTGAKCNQIMDLRVKGLTIDQAWNAYNPVDPAIIEQQVKDKVYAELKSKGDNTPVTGNAPSPSGSGAGHAKTTAEAFAMAEAMHNRRS